MKQHKKDLKVRDGLAAGMIVAGLIFALGCGSSDDDQDNNGNTNNGNTNNGNNITVSGGVDGETTWSGVVDLNGNVQVRGGTLTIEPGTTIIMCADCSLDIGWNSSAVTVLANGTADKPITIKGATAGKGFWGQVIVGRNVTTNSALSHVIIDGAGGADVSASLEVNAAVALTDVTIQNGGSAGVELVDLKAGGDIAVKTVDGYGAVISGSKALTKLPSFTLSELGKNAIYLEETNWKEDAEIVFEDHGAPYYVKDRVDHLAGSVVFKPGVRFLMGPSSDLEFGWNSTETEVLMEGTQDKPVVFEGEVQENGSWGGLTIGRNVLTTSKLAFVHIQYAGEERAALETSAAVSLKDITIKDSATSGLDIIGANGLKPGSARVSVTGGTGYAMRVDGGRLLDTPVGGTIEGNVKNVVAIQKGCDNAQDGVVPAPGVPYLFECTMELHNNAKWTVPGGVTFQLAVDKSFVVGWNSGEVTLKVDGTEQAPVVFEGLEAGTSFWKGLSIERNVTSDSYMRHVVVRGATSEPRSGATKGGLVRMDKLIEVKDSTFASSAGNGLTLARGLVAAGEEAKLDALKDGNTFMDVAGQSVCAVDFTAGPYNCE
jgi:hypothetical protein